MQEKLTYISFLFFLLFVFSVPNSVHADELIIQADHLNVRTGPGVNFDKLKQVHTNEVYPLIQIQGEWAEIDLDKETGWITTEYVEIIKEDAGVDAPVGQSDIDSVTITNDNTQIRQAPTTESDIIGFSDREEEYKVVGETADWYEIEYENQTGYLYKLLIDQKKQRNQSTLKDKVIVIDAGHGGYDVGSIGVNGSYEKDLISKTAEELTQELTMLGAEVILTRENDRYIRLGSRASLSNLHDTDAFISIHYNSFPDIPSVTGMGSFYYQKKDKKLAEAIQNEVIQETGAKNRDIIQGDYQVLRQNYKPAVLLELDFISNAEVEQLLQTNAYQKKMVEGIIKGLSTYFQ